VSPMRSPHQGRSGGGGGGGSFVRVNHRIKASPIRCVDSKGEMLGIMPTKDAMRRAQDQGLDLVEITANADPPVCRIMDFGKFKYEQSLKRKNSKKHQQNRPVKEVKFHANVGDHDYKTKVGHAREFLEKGHKVKMTLTFRGRENAHRDLGFEVINRAKVDCDDVSVVDMEPRLIGRNIVLMLGVKSGKS